MSFSQEWDVTYKNGGQLSIWPWSDLVSLVMRHARPKSPDFRVLEVGFGAGANIRLFQELGVQYFGIEGSASVVHRVGESYPHLKTNLVVGDFTQEIPFAGDFDLVVDRSSITHNPTKNIERCLNLLRAKMKSGGIFIGIDWFSTEHSDRKLGTPTDDDYTYKDIPKGQFAGVGKVHFSDERHLRHLFKDFELMVLEHKVNHRILPADGPHFASWNLVARKI